MHLAPRTSDLSPQMTFWTLIRRSLRFHARSHFGVVLGASIASATLIGALVVGDSVKETLRQRALQRLAGAWYALAPVDRFLSQATAEQLTWAPKTSFSRIGNGTSYPVAFRGSALLVLSGTASQSSGNARANHVQIFGVDESWFLDRPSVRLQEGCVLVNRQLAAQIGVRIGDEVVLRM